MNIQARLAPLFCVATLSVGTIAIAGEHEHRHHDSHEHGVAELNIAIDGKHVLIELDSPAANIVGFEHAPQNPQQQDLVDHAINTLEHPENFLLFTPSAECLLEDSEIETGLTAKQHDHHHDGASDAPASRHSEFNVSYRFSCDKIAKLKYVDVKLFSRFEGLEDIKVQMITPNRQGLLELNPSHTKIEF